MVNKIASGWYAKRFTEDQRKTRVYCVVCAGPMWFPPSKAGKYTTCGGECREQKDQATHAAARRLAKEQTPSPQPRTWSCAHCAKNHFGGKKDRKFCDVSCLSAHRDASAAALAMERTRVCKHCGNTFLVKKSQIDAGQGIHCSVRCAFDAGALSHLGSAQNLQRAQEGLRRAIAEGRRIYAKGENHHSWRPDRDEMRTARRIKYNAWQRAYRKENPEYSRGAARRRSLRVNGRLPRGTVKRLGELQRWKCAVCRVCIKKQFHVDHIVPLAKGGAHERTNIQLLCPSCNVRKSAKDPIRFMQERGFLL